MNFISPDFLLFFISVCLINYLVRPGLRMYVFLAGSLFFIGCFNTWSLGALVFLTTLNYFAGREIHSGKNPSFYYAVIAANIIAILMTNYFLTLSGAIGLRQISYDSFEILITVGISFYSLQHIAYLVDVKNNRIAAEPNWLRFMVFSAYFPRFVSGPLSLYQDFIRSLPSGAPSQSLLVSGFNRILGGFLKKMVIADRLAPSVNALFDYPEPLPGLTVVSAGLLFTVQLYFDFSAYTDIAIGCSRMLGINLKENFSLPFRSASITMFWRRWHQSLIHFFTVYIFYPIAFRYRKAGTIATAFAIAITFAISAIWHGVGLTFLLWGSCHIIYLLFELEFRAPADLLQASGSRFRKVMNISFVLLLVSFSNIFFRSTGLENCGELMGQIFSANFIPDEWLRTFFAPMALGGHQQNIFNFIFTILMASSWLLLERRMNRVFNNGKISWFLIFSTLLLILLFGVFGSNTRFIYMQFT